MNISQQFILKRPPTDICSLNDNIYISTKSKRVFYIHDLNSEKLRNFKSILFSEPVNALSSSNNNIYCACTNGRVFGMDSKHKVMFRASSDISGVTFCKFDEIRRNIIVSTTQKKIQIFTEESFLRNTFYCSDTPIISFDISKDGILSSISENSHIVKIIRTVENNSKKDTVKDIKLQNGFPECLKIHGDYIYIGTNIGIIYIYSITTYKMVAKYVEHGSIYSIHIIDNENFIVGICEAVGSNNDCDKNSESANETIKNIAKIKKHNFKNKKIEFNSELKMPGIPVAFCNYKNKLAVAISREPRLGRWGIMKTGKNKVIIIDINE